MTRASTVTRSAASLLTSRLAVAGIAIVFLGVSTRLLTIEEMAVFAVYNTLCGVLTVACSLGLLAACIKVMPGLTVGEPGSPERAEAARLLRLSVTAYAVGAIIVIGVVWMAASPISRLLLKTPVRAGDVRAAALAALCYGLYEASQLLLSSLQRFGQVGGYNVAAALTQRLLSLALFFPFGLRGYLAGFAIGSLAGAGLGLATILPWMRLPSGAVRPEGARTAGGWIAWSMPFYADGYLRYFYMHADQLLVGIFLTPADLSIYFVAKRFIQYCQVLVSSLVDPLGAKVAELRGRDEQAVARAHAASLRYFVLLFVPLSVLLACESPFLLLVIGGSRYAEAVLPLALLFLSLPPYATFSHLSTFVYVLGSPRERPLIDLVSMAAQALAIVALMPALALSGLAVARVIGFAASAAVARQRLTRCLPTAATRGGTGAARALARCAGPTALMAALILGPHLMIGRPAMLPLFAIPAAAVCALGYFAGVLTPADRAALASMVPGGGRAARSMRTALAGPAGSPPGAGSP